MTAEYSVTGLIQHARNVLQDMEYAHSQGYPLAQTCRELQAALDALREQDDQPEDGPDRAWEADYRAHSSSITGLYEAP